MNVFAAYKSVVDKPVTTYVSTVTKIMLQQSISNTLVLDKDSKFLGVFHQVVDLLQINSHTLLGGTHDGILVERVNRFMNEGLRVMTTERGSIRVALDTILFLFYAWNSSPVS